MSSSPRTQHADHSRDDLMEKPQIPASPANTQATTADRLFLGALSLFAGSIAFSVLGMLLLQLVPDSLSYFGPYLGTLISTPTWTYMSMLPPGNVRPTFLFVDLSSLYVFLTTYTTRQSQPRRFDGGASDLCISRRPTFPWGTGAFCRLHRV